MFLNSGDLIFVRSTDKSSLHTLQFFVIGYDDKFLFTLIYDLVDNDLFVKPDLTTVIYSIQEWVSSEIYTIGYFNAL